MVAPLLFVLLGTAGLVVGADLALDMARRWARRLGVSELVVGLTVASVGTSMPELATSMGGAIASTGEGGQDAVGVAIGNILGSNLFLMSALLGAVAWMVPLPVDRDALRRDGGAVFVATIAAGAFMLDGHLERFEGLALLGGYAAYLGALAWSQRGGGDTVGAPGDDVPLPEPEGQLENRVARAMDALPGPVWAHDTLGVVAGLTVLLFGASLVVDQGVVLAHTLGISATLVGILVGVGTSLPELVISVRAAALNAADLTVGNILGSAIANLGLCLGLAVTVQPVPVPQVARAYDLPFALALTVVALLLLRERDDLTRREGSALLVLFGLYAFVRTVWVQ